MRHTNSERSYLENASLPALKILKIQWVPSKNLASLIENTKGNLSEISINYGYAHNVKNLSRRFIKIVHNLNILDCI